MKPEYEQLKQDILYEQRQLDIVISKISRIGEDITDVKKAALAAYLMNFYNGVENIMKRCAKEYYKRMPKGADWHKQLLRKSYAGNGGKRPLFSEEIVDRLYDYLTFRHLFIHGYEFKLKWEEMKSLIENIDELWGKIKERLTAFVSEMK